MYMQYFFLWGQVHPLILEIIIIIIIYSVDKDANWLLWFETQFTSIAGSDRQIDFNGFKTALKLSEASVHVFNCNR